MTQHPLPDAPSLLSRLLRRMDAAADGAPAADTVPTGFPSVDRLLGGGLRRGDLAVLGGDVGSGKSAFALAVAVRAAEAGRPAAFLSGEMTPERVLERALALEGRARLDDLRHGTLDDAARATVGAAAARLRTLPLTVARLRGDGAPVLTDDLAALDGAALVVADPLQWLATGARPLDEELAAVVRRLKTIAVERDVALLVTAHLPAHTSDRGDPRPRLDDFGALGAVKQHADVVLALFREELYQADRAAEGAVELLALKHRGGAPGYADLYFYKQWVRFEDMVEPGR